jgi:serine/threonine-protein kinase
MAQARARRGEHDAVKEHSPARWSRLRQVFDLALDLPPHERAALVEQLAQSDEQLRLDVLELLAQHDNESDLLDGGAKGFLAEEELHVHNSLVGARMGPYRVVREIASGGMGTVYEGARDDAEFEKRVAIKLIRPGLDGQGIIRRFRRERQILAALDHPNVARLLDGGLFSDGRPFLVMEYVEGQAIDAFSDERRLGVRARIELFLRVCDAVEHAHRNLIVHRDIKPGNILVTKEGVPKLLDFGVAKLLTDGGAGENSSATTADTRFLTIEFASPEQLRDERITTASDVYSLGLVLYKLLAGVQPFSSTSRTVAEIGRILTTDPAPPSMVVTSDAATQRAEQDESRLRKRLAGDLDNIVLTSIRKEPARRYASVQQFADDLRRYLDGMPVLAQKDTMRYRLRKFAGRHRAGVAAVIFIALSLVGGMVATTYQARRAREASRIAEVQRRNAEQVTAFLQDVIGSADPSWYSTSAHPGPKTTLLDAIENAAKDVGPRLAGQPDVEATIRRTLGNTYQSLGIIDSAETQLRIALALRRKQNHGPTLDLARDLRDLAVTLLQKGSYPEATALEREALKVHAAIRDTSSVYLAILTGDLSVGLARMGNLAAADSFGMRALELHRRLFGENHPGVANMLQNQAALRSARGDLPSAERDLMQALAIFDRRNGAVLERSTALMSLGFVRKWRGDYAGSDSVLRKGLAAMEQTVGKQHPYLLVGRTELAYTAFLWGKSDLAWAEIEQAAALAKVAGLAPTHPEMARLLTVRGLILTSRGRARDAERDLRQALAIREKTFGPRDTRTMETTGALGLALVANGKVAEGRAMLAECRAAMLRIYGSADARTRLAMKWENSARLPRG